MSNHARRIVAGKYYIITRSCEQQRFHLKPTRAVRGAMLYALIRAVLKHPSIRIVGFFFMSNHYHVIVYDSGAAMSACFGLANSTTSRCLNSFRGRTGPVWDEKGLSIIPIETTDDLVDKFVYVVMQACKQGIVARPTDWRGLRTLVDQLEQGTTIRAERPSWFFRDAPHNPPVVEAHCQLGPEYDDNPEAFQRFIHRARKQIAAELDALEYKRRAAGRPLVGMRAAMRRPWHSCAKHRHPFRALQPHILAKDPVVRRYLLVRLKAFRADYREAQRRWAAGDLSVVFPYGTLDVAHLPRNIARAPPDRCFLTP